MQSTGHSSTHALSLTSMHALAITYGMGRSPHDEHSRAGPLRVTGDRLGHGRLDDRLDQQGADLESLELPGRGLGQVVGEDDLPWRLEVGQAVPAPGDQLL